MPRFKIQHITRYRYENAVRDSANQIMLFPVRDEYQEVIKHNLLISGNPLIEQHADVFGNQVGTFTHPHPHTELKIDSTCEVLTKRKPDPKDDTAIEEQWKHLEASRVVYPNIVFLRLEEFDALSELQQVMSRIHQPDLTPLQCS